MSEWDHGGGFSVDASVAIHGDDRAGLERLLRYCARPCWASERLTQASDGERLIYTFDKPRPDGSWQLMLTPLELLDRLARFIPAPRRHLHRCYGAFAPHAALRAQVAARAGQAIAAPPCASSITWASRAGHREWRRSAARLVLARLGTVCPTTKTSGKTCAGKSG